MKIAVMQPYLFPYIGYFQLIQSAEKFVFYDDVDFIKQGWINRNRLLINGESCLFTVPLKNVSSSRVINQTEINLHFYGKWKSKFLKTIEQNYKKSPFYKEIFLILNDVLNGDYQNISELSISSVKEVLKYLEINKELYLSSENFGEFKSFNRTERLINYCKKENAETYINMIGGQELYDKNYFLSKDLKLLFLQPNIVEYEQNDNPFIAGLSIIDILMNCSKSQVINMLNQYKLI